MIRSIIFGLIGAAAMYLYLNPGDMAGLIAMFKSAAHDGAVTVQELTSK